MSKNLQKSVQGYMKKITKETRKIQLPFGSISSSSRDRLLAACKSPKKLASAINRNARRLKSRKDIEGDTKNEIVKNEDAAATLNDIDQFLQENFKSLYLDDDGDAPGKNKSKKKLNSNSDEDDEEDDDRPDGENGWPGRIKFDSPKHSDRRSDLCRSERSIFGPPSSALFTDDQNPTTTNTAVISDDIESDSNSNASSIGRYQTDDAEEDSSPGLPEDCIAVLRYTTDPYEDFRQSMLEIVEARIGRKGSNVDWDFMEELLICYLDMNDIKSHRFVLGAFVDLIVAFRRFDYRVPRRGFVRSRSLRLARERTKRRMKNL